MRFVDTNVLLYAFTAEDERAAKARTLLTERDLAFSTQVLQEFYVQATRASRPDRIGHADAAELVEALTRFPIAHITTAIVLAAIEASARFQISYWDAAIIEAARALGCESVLSEDLSHGRDYSGVRVENPFV